jgi:hypothetical protein
MSDEHDDLHDEAAYEARTVEFIRLLMGKALDVYDVEVHPPTATSGATITVDDDVYQALDERAAAFWHDRTGAGRARGHNLSSGIGVLAKRCRRALGHGDSTRSFSTSRISRSTDSAKLGLSILTPNSLLNSTAREIRAGDE